MPWSWRQSLQIEQRAKIKNDSSSGLLGSGAGTTDDVDHIRPTEARQELICSSGLEKSHS